MTRREWTVLLYLIFGQFILAAAAMLAAVLVFE